MFRFLSAFLVAKLLIGFGVTSKLKDKLEDNGSVLERFKDKKGFISTAEL